MLQSGEVVTNMVDVREGDLIILATDGLWDNLTNNDVLRITSTYLQSRKRDAQGELAPLCPKTMAKMLVEEASNANIKPDDITAIVGIIQKC